MKNQFYFIKQIFKRIRSSQISFLIMKKKKNIKKEEEETRRTQQNNHITTC